MEEWTFEKRDTRAGPLPAGSLKASTPVGRGRGMGRIHVAGLLFLFRSSGSRKYGRRRRSGRPNKRITRRHAFRRFAFRNPFRSAPYRASEIASAGSNASYRATLARLARGATPVKLSPDAANLFKSPTVRPNLSRAPKNRESGFRCVFLLHRSEWFPAEAFNNSLLIFCISGSGRSSFYSGFGG